jgi:hypothetical protein
VKDVDDAVAVPDAPPFVGTLIERCADEDVTDPLAVVALVEWTSLQLFTLPAESVLTMYAWLFRLNWSVHPTATKPPSEVRAIFWNSLDCVVAP